MYVLLLNIKLDKSIIPESWGKGILISIFKSKGSKSDPNSYRGVTLNSCISQMFSAVLNNRLTKCSDEFELITNAHAGFRKGFSTNDNMFILHALISIYFSFEKKLFCSFIDFKSAFDTVWRIGLWQKMQKSNVQGKNCKVINCRYQNIKFVFEKEMNIQIFFNYEIGVKQGGNLSPYLFSLYLNDLEHIFGVNNLNGLESISAKCLEQLGF